MRLKPEVARQIVGFIRGGAYPMVAAEASGVPRAIFKAWLKQGENPRAGRAYREFAREVQQAAAQARLIQERAVYEKEPRFWLSHGPGRESQDFPGWSSEVKPVEAVTGPVVELSRHPDWQSLVMKLMDALAEFPDARATAASALAGDKHAKPWLQHSN